MLYTVIIFRFIVKLSPLPVVFSPKGFHVNLMFFFVFVFYYCVINQNSIALLDSRTHPMEHKITAMAGLQKTTLGSWIKIWRRSYHSNPLNGDCYEKKRVKWTIASLLLLKFLLLQGVMFLLMIEIQLLLLYWPFFLAIFVREVITCHMSYYFSLSWDEIGGFLFGIS